MSKPDYVELNRKAWDKAAPIHQKATLQQLKEAFANPDFLYLNKIALDGFRNLGIQHRSIAQLLCNNGRELISLKRLGAGRCVGFDLSSEFVALGVELAEAANLPCEFVASDVYKIPQEFNGSFDIVFVSSGSLIWLPDLKDFFTVINRLLKPGGIFFLVEIHPFLHMFDATDKAIPPTVRRSYFSTDAREHTDGLDYWGGDAYDSPPAYLFSYTISGIFSASLENKLLPIHFGEYELDLSAINLHLQQAQLGMPLSFSYMSRKAA